MPTLSGVQLQWSRLFQPYALNFVQYRKVMNLTLTAAAADDVTPFTVLPMVFEDVRQFTVPGSQLAAGTYYEFRKGFPFPTYTYYSDSVVVKTFDASSPFVNHVTPIGTNQSLSVYWQQPEYGTGLVGYNVRVLYLGYGNGGLSHAGWNVSQLNVFATYHLALTQTSIFVGCTDGVNGCLAPYTTYLLEFAAVRERGLDAPSYVYTSTKKTAVVTKVITDFIYVYGGWIVVDLQQSVAQYNGSALTSTVLWPAYVVSHKGDINVTLSGESTVSSMSGTAVQITLGDAEYSSLVRQIGSHAYSPLRLVTGTHQSFVLTSYCM